MSPISPVPEEPVIPSMPLIPAIPPIAEASMPEDPPMAAIIDEAPPL